MSDDTQIGSSPDPDSIPASHLPLIPQPGRRASDEPQVPFDPSGFAVLKQLEEVEKKPEKAQGVLTPAQIADARRKAKFVPKFSSLESMYATNPELVNSGKLRIERIQPQWYDDEYGQKMRVSGVIAFKHPIIGDEQFTNVFGGFKYRVFGLLDQENRENKGGPPQSTEVAVAEFEVPLPPNILNLPIAGLDAPADAGAPPMMNSPYGRRMGTPMGYPGQVPNQAPDYNPFISIAERALNRNNDGLPNAAWDVIGRTNQSSMDAIRQTSDRQMELLSDQNRRLEAALEAERQRTAEAGRRPTDVAEMVDGMSRLVASTKGSTDSDVIRQMRDDHDRTISRINQDHEQKLARISQEFERSNQRLKEEGDRALAREREHAQIQVQASDARIQDLERQMAARDREWKDEAERRENRAKEDAERSLSQREREHAQLLQMIQQQHDREMKNMQQMHEREVHVLETVRDSTDKAGRQAHEIELRAAKDDASKASAELALVKERVKEFEAARNKPLIEQVEEMQRTTEAIQEIAGTGGSDDEGDDGKSDKWYDSPIVRDIAGTLAREGAKMVPSIAEGVKGGLGKKGNGAAARPPMAAGPPAMAPPMRQPGSLPPRRKPRVTFADADGPRLARPGGAKHLKRPDRRGDISASKTAPKPYSADAPPVDYSGSQAPAGWGAEPPQEQMRAPAPATRPKPAQPTAQQVHPVNPAPQPASPSQPPAAADGQTDWSDFAWMPMAPEDLQTFVLQLNYALVNQGEPQALADAFIQNYPTEVIHQLIMALDMQRFIETIRTSDATSGLPLASGRGRRFLADTWKLLAEHLETVQSQTNATASASVPPAAPAPPAETEQPGETHEPDEQETQASYLDDAPTATKEAP